VGKFLGILLSCIVAAALVEAAARLVLGPPNPPGVLVFSENPFQISPGDVMRFRPAREIRALSVFGTAREFDVRFKSNNLGFVDDLDYPLAAKSRNIAIVGDSYTAGYHGGRPWVPRLRQSLPNANIYNLGVTGTGFEQFAALLDDVAATTALDQVVIVAISSDAVRRSWRYFVHDGRLFLCARQTPKQACLAKPSNILLVDAKGSEAALAARIDAHHDATPSVGLRRYLSRHTHVGQLFHTRTWRPRSKALDTIEVPAFTLAALKRVRARFAKRSVTLIHLPEKREVLAGAYAADLAGAAKAAGLRFVDGLKACKLTVADYFPRDPHPNDVGYEKIRICVAKALR